MNDDNLKSRVRARDRLLQQAEDAGQHLNEAVLQALARGEPEAVEHATRRHERQLRELTENLRIYQAELHAQADELEASQARTAEVLERFSTLFASMPVAALLVASNGEVLEHNLLAERQLALRPQAVGARFMHRLVDTDHFQAAVRPAFLRAQAVGAAHVESLVFVGEQGDRFVGELHIARLPTREGQSPTYACAVIDRTEPLRNLHALEAAAQALRQSESFLSDTARVARTGGWELTLHPRQLRWSLQLRALLGLPEAQPPSLAGLLALCEPHDRPALASALACSEQGTPFELELDMRTAGELPMRVLAVGHPELQGTQVVRVHGVLQDVSSQVLQRRELGDLSDRLAMANDAGGIGVWDCDLLKGEVALDERMAAMLGLAPGAHAGTLLTLLAPLLLSDSARLLDEGLSQALETQRPLNLELHLATEASPVERWLHVTGRAHVDTRGRAVRLVGCAWDSSPQHEALRLLAAKEAAEGASRAKSAFLSRMSHELRTPLNAILGFSQLMRIEAEGGDLVVKPHRVALIESAARHLLALVNEVLDVSRIESGRVDVSPEAVDLRSLVAEALPLVQGLASDVGVQLHGLPPGGGPLMARADRLRLKQVLINLASNAIKYNRPGGQVWVTAQAIEGEVVLRVADSGRGLSPAQVQGLFQPFNRVGAEALGIEGSGMGLFVCHQFVTLMGGRIEVQGEVNRGAVFSVFLPSA